MQLCLERQTTKKVTRRIVPFLIVLYVIAFIDRANLGYAALDMNEALALTSKMFGIVSGIFFISYFLFEIPSNVMLEKVRGAKMDCTYSRYVGRRRSVHKY
ncbi:hypothetical protein [Peribacillus sp. R9-11]|uniref:hypothetical protein n=1 Tax=Peribacillus sp. R9-11 TaxID=3073271 RepID=UPI0028687890|nr:hypothetical protein [Peribacillus sp. R9-11]WMX57701.1 hypothetical protein RE409_11070 [Peribacillus sp. R9-11]